MTLRPSPRRIAAIILLGPLVGTTFLLVFALLLPPRPGVPPASDFIIVMLAFGYLFGLLPAMLSAWLYRIFYPRLYPLWPHVVGSLLIGATGGLLGVFLTIFAFARGFAFEPAMLLAGTIAGAIALPLIALPFSQRA